MQSTGFKTGYGYRCAAEHASRRPARRAVAALFERRRRRRRRPRRSHCYTRWTAGAVLSLNDRGWRWVHARAGEIALGSWIDEAPAGLPEINVAVTFSALRPALSS
jgi:hypothetical protein